MGELIIIVILYAVIFSSIFLFYKLRKIRHPFSGLGFKDDVNFDERLLISFIISIPLLVFFIKNYG
tara:strand:+ start:82 stop:279 length:198 start_codon:yes stop_codon:yes gene_type:complete